MRAWPTVEDVAGAITRMLPGTDSSDAYRVAVAIVRQHAEPIREREEALNMRMDAMVAADFSTLTDVLTTEYQRGVADGREEAAQLAFDHAARCDAMLNRLEGDARAAWINARDAASAVYTAINNLLDQHPTRPAGETGGATLWLVTVTMVVFMSWLFRGLAR